MQDEPNEGQNSRKPTHRGTPRPDRRDVIDLLRCLTLEVQSMNCKLDQIVADSEIMAQLGVKGLKTGVANTQCKVCVARLPRNPGADGWTDPVGPESQDLYTLC
jgi:hypothetical protein